MSLVGRAGLVAGFLLFAEIVSFLWIGTAPRSAKVAFAAGQSVRWFVIGLLIDLLILAASMAIVMGVGYGLGPSLPARWSAEWRTRLAVTVVVLVLGVLALGGYWVDGWMAEKLFGS